jgi:hypothetical protein
VAHEALHALLDDRVLHEGSHHFLGGERGAYLNGLSNGRNNNIHGYNISCGLKCFH